MQRNPATWLLEKGLLSQGICRAVAYHTAQISRGQAHLNLCRLQLAVKRLVPGKRPSCGWTLKRRLVRIIFHHLSVSGWTTNKSQRSPGWECNLPSAWPSNSTGCTVPLSFSSFLVRCSFFWLNPYPQVIEHRKLENSLINVISFYYFRIKTRTHV